MWELEVTARSLCRYEEVGEVDEVAPGCKYAQIWCVGVVSEESPDVTSRQSLTQTDRPNQFDQDLNN